MIMQKRFPLIVLALLFSSVPVLSAGSFQGADLAVYKSGPEQAAVDTDVTYTIEVDNNGPDTAGNAQLIDSVPAGMTFVSFAQTSGPTWTCTTPSPGGTGNVTCSVASLDVSGAGTSIFTFVGHIDRAVAPGTLITNVARVTSQADPNDENDSSSAVTVIPSSVADLAVAKNANTDQALANSDVTYTIQVSNAGSQDAMDAELDDTLPGNMTFVSLAQPSGWTCSTPAVGAGGAIKCTNPDVSGASTSTFTLKGHIPSGSAAGTPYQNTATVSSSNDPNSENDSSDAFTTVVAAAPALTTQASASVLLGGSISDTATLSGGFSATGTMVFYAFGPDDSTCGGSPAFTSFVNVAGDGQYNSGSYVPTTPGTDSAYRKA